MYVAMNRFKILTDGETEFIEHWRRRDSHLNGVPGFLSFNLLRGPVTDEYVLFASHSIWESEQAFLDWTHSDAFRMAHAGAKSTRRLYLEPPRFEGFAAVL